MPSVEVNPRRLGDEDAGANGKAWRLSSAASYPMNGCSSGRAFGPLLPLAISPTGTLENGLLLVAEVVEADVL